MVGGCNLQRDGRRARIFHNLAELVHCADGQITVQKRYARAVNVAVRLPRAESIAAPHASHGDSPETNVAFCSASGRQVEGH